MRQVPAAPVLALLKAFDPTNSDPAATMNAAATDLSGALDPRSLDDLNDGQYAALIDRTIDLGIDAFQATRLFALVNGGNLTLPIYEFKSYGNRGLAELDVWLAGNAP